MEAIQQVYEIEVKYRRTDVASAVKLNTPELMDGLLRPFFEPSIDHYESMYVVCLDRNMQLLGVSLVGHWDELRNLQIA